MTHNLKPLFRLMVLYTHNKEGVPYAGKGHLQPYKKLTYNGILRLERHLVKRVRHWQYAFVVPAGGSLLRLWYYLPSEMVNYQLIRLNKDQYKEALSRLRRAMTSYFLWIIPTMEHKIQVNDDRAQTATVHSLDALKTYFKGHILRIDIYQYRQKLGYYDGTGIHLN